MAEFCRGIVPKPRAEFLRTIVELGAPGLRGFFDAYAQEADSSIPRYKIEFEE